MPREAFLRLDRIATHAGLFRRRPTHYEAGVFSHGYLTLGRPWGIAVRLHGSTPVAVLLAGVFWPGLALGLVALILVHGLGHAFVAVRCGARVDQIDILPFGGAWRTSGKLSPLRRACAAWGGIWAQSVLLIATVGLLAIFGASPGGVFEVLAVINALLILINLIPIEPFDGAAAWPIFRVWRRQREPVALIPAAPTKRPPPLHRMISRKGPTDVISDKDLPPEIREAMEKAVKELRARR